MECGRVLSAIILALPRISATLLAIILFLHLTAVAKAERVNICNKKRFSAPSGTACSFNSQLGEDVIVRASFVDTPYLENAYFSLDPFVYNERVLDGQEKSITKRINWGENKATKVLFSIPYYLPSRYMDIEVYADRTNLKANESHVDTSNGDLILRYGVTTQTAFNPVASVSFKAWASNYHGHKGQILGTWYPTGCFTRGYCASRLTNKLIDRTPIDRGKNRLEVVIDADNGQAETNESDNHFSIELDNFFAENIPTIMGNRSYNKAKNFLNAWYDNGRKQKRTDINAIDWQLTTIVSGNTNWFLNPSNASNNRIINRFNQLTSPNYFFSQPFKTELKKQLKDKFTPGVTQVQLSKPYIEGDNIRDYHKQHAQHRVGQEYTYPSLPHIDHVTTAFGNFSFYLVPQGTASILNAQKYQVVINKVAVHVVDSFDFNNLQYLGCWGLPNKISEIPGIGLKCFFNSSFREYRNFKARGNDHNIFMRPTIVTLASPLVFQLNRN